MGTFNSIMIISDSGRNVSSFVSFSYIHFSELSLHFFSQVKAMYALIPRVMIIKFIEMCPQCSTSHIYMAKRRRQAAQGTFITADKLAGVRNISCICIDEIILNRAFI